MLNDEIITKMQQNPDDFRILKRIPNALDALACDSEQQFKAVIIDLETMGMDSHSHEIIEIGMLSFLFNNDGIVAVADEYNELNDPGKPIPQEIVNITGITDEDVKARQIDWQQVAEILNTSHLVICHNSGFDRKFLENQTPDEISQIVKLLPFACTVKDINWTQRGYESAKLEYLNFKLGYFYDGHRAIIDCWATLNLLLQEQGSFDELKQSVKQKQAIICAQGAPFEKKDLLKNNGYRWSADEGSDLGKCWWKKLLLAELEDEESWLDDEIYKREGKAKHLPKKIVTAKTRFSERETSGA